MATFYIQLENRLLQISGDLTAENISKALGYVPVSPNVTNELSQRVDNITFDSLKDNPFLQDGSGELNIVDEVGNIIAKIDADGIHSVDFIAGEHILSNKADKTYIDNLELDELNAILVDTDAVADDPIVPDYVTETELETALSGKMDKVTLSTVATSGSYNDLTNKPTIPNAVTEHTVSGWGFTKNAGTYSKPSTGIPKTDLDSAVQTSLGKADTALQSHQDISGKQDKLVSGTNIKTINGTSILGSGNIVISGGGGESSGNTAYPEIVFPEDDYFVEYISPNTFYVFPECKELEIGFEPETLGKANEYLFQFTSGIESTVLTISDDIKWANDAPPTIEPNMIYQVSILKGLASVLEFKGKLIRFSIYKENTEQYYYGEENMTWKDWTNSSYNTDGYSILGSLIIDNTGSYNIDSTISTDTIIPNHFYTLVLGGGGPT